MEHPTFCSHAKTCCGSTCCHAGRRSTNPACQSYFMQMLACINLRKSGLRCCTSFVQLSPSLYTLLPQLRPARYFYSRTVTRVSELSCEQIGEEEAPNDCMRSVYLIHLKVTALCLPNCSYVPIRHSCPNCPPRTPYYPVPPNRVPSPYSPDARAMLCYVGSTRIFTALQEPSSGLRD